jgi:hypothetical protein
MMKRKKQLEDRIIYHLLDLASEKEDGNKMKRGNEARINHESESRQKRKKTGRAGSTRIEVRMNKLLIRSESR